MKDEVNLMVMLYMKGFSFKHNRIISNYQKYKIGIPETVYKLVSKKA